MKKPRKSKLLSWEVDEPKFIIIDDRDRVFTGLIGGYANFSYDIEEAKPLDGQEKFQTLKRFIKLPLEQIFL
jgi:hypothetical protein